MDWPTAAVILAAISILFMLVIGLGIYKFVMWMIRSAVKTSKKTAHAITYPFNPRR